MANPKRVVDLVRAAFTRGGDDVAAASARKASRANKATKTSRTSQGFARSVRTILLKKYPKGVPGAILGLASVSALSVDAAFRFLMESAEALLEDMDSVTQEEAEGFFTRLFAAAHAEGGELTFEKVASEVARSYVDIDVQDAYTVILVLVALLNKVGEPGFRRLLGPTGRLKLGPLLFAARGSAVVCLVSGKVLAVGLLTASLGMAGVYLYCLLMGEDFITTLANIYETLPSLSTESGSDELTESMGDAGDASTKEPGPDNGSKEEWSDILSDALRAKLRLIAVRNDADGYPTVTR